MEEFGEYLCWGMEAKAFSWGGIECVGQSLHIIVGEAIWFCFQWDKAADAAVHVFDTALLPRAVWITEIVTCPQTSGRIELESFV